MKVGIDALGVAVPSLCIDLEVLAKARGVDPLKYLDGLGTWRMGVAPIDEDTVTLAARAAAMAMKSAQATPDEIGMLVVGTETAVDHSKPVSSFVQGLLGIGTRCRVFETKHACYGGTAAMMMALDWIRSGSANGKKALIVCSDIARYGLKTAGEPTQGAGAVALVVSANPRLVELNPAHTGQYASDVHDFWRPLYSKDAFVDGHYSVQCYLDAITGAYKHFKELEPTITANDFAALAYHVPYGKMAKKAHRQLRTLEGDTAPDASFDAQVSASLSLPAQVGNIYTGSLYLALTSLLATSARSLDGQRIGLFSYGSGSCAEFFAGTVVPGSQERVRVLGLQAMLDARTKLTIDEYEAIMRAREEADVKPVEAKASDEYRFLGVEAHKRTYVGPRA
jgi:hydroxymethylglutaryl-CoA synthase